MEIQAETYSGSASDWPINKAVGHSRTAKLIVQSTWNPL